MASGKALMEAVTHSEITLTERTRLEGSTTDRGILDVLQSNGPGSIKEAFRMQRLAKENLQNHIKQTYGVYAYRLKEVI